MNPNIQVIREIPDKENPQLVSRYFKSIISFSHVMGSVSSFVVNYIKSAFGDKYFKTIWNTQEVPYSQRSKSFRDMMTKPRPIMIIDPKFDPSVESDFLPQMEYDNWLANEPEYDVKIQSLNSFPLITYKNFKLYCRPKRYKMAFTINFVFDSDIQRIQCQEFIRQSIRHRSPITMHTYLENILPDSYIKAIAELVNLDYTSDEFLNFINSLTSLPITRRIRTGSGNIEFFAMQKTPIDMIFTEGPSSNGPIKKGNIVVSSSFSEEINIEFVAYSLIHLVTHTTFGKNIKPEIPIDIIDTEMSQNMTAVGTENMMMMESPIIPEEYKNCQKFKQITFQADTNGDDIIDLKDIILTPEVKVLYDYYKDNNMPIDFFEIKLFDNTSDITDLDSYEFDVVEENIDY